MTAPRRSRFTSLCSIVVLVLLSQNVFLVESAEPSLSSSSMPPQCDAKANASPSMSKMKSSKTNKKGYSPIPIPPEMGTDFYFPSHIMPGEMLPFRWTPDAVKAERLEHIEEDDTYPQVDQHGRLVGLPPELTEEIRQFTIDTGLDHLFRLLGEDRRSDGEEEDKKDPLNMGFNSGLLLELDSPKESNLTQKLLWSIKTPGSHDNWSSDPETRFFWIDAADEASMEASLKVLARGNFDLILESMAREFGTESGGYMIGGMGFIVSSHVPDGRVHNDLMTEHRKVWFDLLFPLILPEDEDADLQIGNMTQGMSSPLEYTPNLGFLLEADTEHATAECDYREAEEVRVSVSIYIMDVTEENVEDMVTDTTAFFPIPEITPWHMAQRGRFVKRGSLKDDVGRLPLENMPEEDDEFCQEHKHLCVDPMKDVREMCWKTCGVYMDDESYYATFFPESAHLLNGKKERVDQEQEVSTS